MPANLLSSLTSHIDEAVPGTKVDSDMNMVPATDIEDGLDIQDSNDDDGNEDHELLLDDREEEELLEDEESDDIRDEDPDGEPDWEIDVAMYEMYGEDYDG